MKKTIQRPTLNEVAAVQTMRLSDTNGNLLIFNPERVGPTNFAGLRQADYGLGFRMPTMPELVNLTHASLENHDYEPAKKIINTLRSRSHCLIGNTGILHVHKGMFVQDNPVLKNGRILMNQKMLEKRLGSHRERGVVFSDDGKIRFVPSGFKREPQSALELSQNPGIIALTGSGENAERLARVSDLYRVNPCLFAPNKTNSPKTKVTRFTRVPGLCYSGEFDEGLNIYAGLSEFVSDFFSFGVWDGETEGVSANNRPTSFM